MIRKVSLEEIDLIIPIGNEYNNNFSNLYVSANYDYYVFIEKDMVVGFLITENTVDESSIILLFVKEEYRRKKIGSLLLDYYFTSLNIKYKRTILEVRKDNIAAVSLYYKFGFDIIATRPKYYDNKTDAIIMERRNAL